MTVKLGYCIHCGQVNITCINTEPDGTLTHCTLTDPKCGPLMIDDVEVPEPHWPHRPMEAKAIEDRSSEIAFTDEARPPEAKAEAECDRSLETPAEPGLRDAQRLDWLEHVMTYDDNYVEVYLSGLRNQTGKATAFQVEVNPEKIATLNAPTLREAIDAAQGKWEREVTEEHAARTPPQKPAETPALWKERRNEPTRQCCEIVHEGHLPRL